MKQLEGKVALITGGGTGIGAAVAERFTAEGARVCITGRRQQPLDAVIASLPPGTGKAVPGDVANAEDRGRMMETVLSFNGGIDVLVNCAGIAPAAGGAADVDIEEWRKTFEVNVTGPLMLMKASIPHMIKAGGGSIINVASMGGVQCIPEAPGYCASKAALIHLTKQVALDYGRYKIRCNAVSPGWVRTAMTDDPFTELAKAIGTDLESLLGLMTGNLPLRRASLPKEIAGICCYLASDDSGFMTGTNSLIDGGSSVVDPGSAVISTDPRFALFHK
jgi:meso-butanediol dehydrogenase / (S,S)-butanediol dehydrogenase / diacetyl reductase